MRDVSAKDASDFRDLPVLFGVFAFFIGGGRAEGRTGLSGSYAGWIGDLGTFGVEAVGFEVHLVARPVLLGVIPNDVGVYGRPTSRKWDGLGVDDEDVPTSLGP